MDLGQYIQQAIQVLDFRSANGLIQVPAQHRAGVDHVIGQDGGRSIGHLSGDAVVLAVFTGQFLVVDVDLVLEPHEVLATGDLVDGADQAFRNQRIDLALVNDHDVAQIAFHGAGGVHIIADNLRGDDV